MKLFNRWKVLTTTGKNKPSPNLAGGGGLSTMHYQFIMTLILIMRKRRKLCFEIVKETGTGLTI